ncbi:hypothetical protein EVAR_43194_1 [Eumeta japonica]|uniref:Uncharacterized protein n=1 Tax=Eumeta variegata TaxID=151549 RepID=A0A4C1WVA2_EUMVA|nr:hypothetical protein EVAR_43194_1 [Eumeta japonica]
MDGKVIDLDSFAAVKQTNTKGSNPGRARAEHFGVQLSERSAHSSKAWLWGMSSSHKNGFSKDYSFEKRAFSAPQQGYVVPMATLPHSRNNVLSSV